MTSHYICRKSDIYPVSRASVPTELVPWNVPCPSYDPPCFSHLTLHDPACSDPDIHDQNFKPKWNAKDDVNRISFNTYGIRNYDVVDNYPLNPVGRTGLRGKGYLQRWGPNHAASAVLTRWKRFGEDYKIVGNDVVPILQVLMIKRRDNHQWALPGTFLKQHESPAGAAVRRLFKEAVIAPSPAHLRDALINFFKNGRMIYRGYIDDVRNTDNAWVEEFACGFHDHGQLVDILMLNARGGAIDVSWKDITDDMEIYKSHNPIIENIYEFHMKNIYSLRQIHPNRSPYVQRLYLPYYIC